ncbi:zinc finger CCCH domain-containing protein 65-like [Papaver somniferum]|uniref:zinc finger CCCH domain-containing protein 65-like n=1 Tax=Papaver somniferum TaxID=3469 RepID=UPI000E70279D|nr:zinc finger CCCH domain-containing protein 65-like [Papaver somniferum]
MGEAIHSGFRRRRSHLKSKTVDTLLKIMSLCADDQESQNSLPVVSDAINSGVRRNGSENELVKDKSAEVVLGLEDSAILDDEVGSFVIKEPQQRNVDEAKVVDEHITNEILEPITHTEDMQVQSSSSEPKVVNEVAGEHQQEETCLAELVNLDSSVSLPADTGIENVVAGEQQQEETSLSEQVNLDSAASLLTDMDIEDGEIPDGLGLYNELVDLIHEDLASNEEKSVGKDQSQHGVIKESEFEARQQDDLGAVEKYMSSTCTPEEILMKKNKRKLDRDYAVGVGNRNLKRGYGDDLLLGAGNGGKEIEEANVDAPAKKACLIDRNLEQGYGDDRLQQAGNTRGENSEAKVAAITKEVELCNRKLERGYDDDWLGDAGTSGKDICEAEVHEKTKKNTKVVEKRLRVVGKERKEKKKMNGRKKRAQTRREQGVKRLRIEPQISKPKPPKYCEFYLKGRCQKGDSCKFSHDTTPLTKSQPCKFLALQQCLKGDDCPFDHQLSKYPCNNFASNGSCYRGDKCLFSHKIAETPKPSDVTPTEAVSQHSPNNINTKRSQNTKNISPCTLDKVSSGGSLKTPSTTGSQVHKNPEQSVLEKLRSPAQPPKGVTLLSFGNSPSNNSSVRPPAQPPKGVTLLSFGNSPPNHSSIRPAVQPPKGVTLLSFGNSPLNNSSNKTNSNGTEASTQKDQETLKTPQSSNELFQKTTPSTLASASQCSQNPLQNAQNKNSAQSSPSSSALSFAAKYESEMMKNRSKIPTGLCTTTTSNSSKTPSSSTAASSSIDNIQNRLLKASPLLQEFLFGFGGTDGKL